MKKEDKKTECDCCHFETMCHLYAKDQFQIEGVKNYDRWLCQLCAGTMTSQFKKYYNQHDQDIATAMQAMCYIGNSIIEKLNNLPTPTPTKEQND